MESHTVKIPIVDLFPNRQGVIDGKGFNRFYYTYFEPHKEKCEQLEFGE